MTQQKNAVASDQQIKPKVIEPEDIVVKIKQILNRKDSKHEKETFDSKSSLFEEIFTSMLAAVVCSAVAGFIIAILLVAVVAIFKWVTALWNNM